MSKSQNDKKNIALIGTGISGLSCLYFYLKKNAQTVSQIDIFEQRSTIGGVLTNTKENAFVLEHGAQGVLSSRKNFITLIEELNLGCAVSAIPSAQAHRHFFFKNRIIRISPKNIFLMLRTNLISVFAIVRILSELSVKKSKNNQNETVESFFVRRFGKKFTKNFLTPVMKGIWGGGASKILIRFAFPKLQQIEEHHGSILKYFIRNLRANKSSPKKMISFEEGMKQLPDALINAIEQISISNRIDFKIHLNQKFPPSHEKKYDQIIYSGQPWQEKDYICIDSLYSSLKTYNSDTSALENIHRAWDVLAHMPTHSLYVVGIGSKNNDVQNKLDGFGALAVENNDEGVLGVICVHSLNKMHAPDDSFLYRVILGGENIPTHIDFKNCTDSEIITLAKKYLYKHHLLEINKTYLFEHVVRHVNYVPLATQEQDKILQSVSDLESVVPGLYFVGNYLLGPAVDNCIEYGRFVADKMID